MKLTLSRTALGVLCLLLPLMSGGAAAYLLTRSDHPTALGSPTPVETVPVLSRSISETYTVDVLVMHGTVQQLRTSREGRVTGLECKREGGWSNGSSNIEIDGDPIVNLSTEKPLWRDLYLGDFGQDVSQLQAQISNLGYDSEGNGVVGPRLMASIAELMEANGRMRRTSGVISVSDFMWLPAAAVQVESCPLSVGQMVSPDQVVAEQSANLLGIRIDEMPVFVGEGDLELVIDDNRIPIDRSGAVEREYLPSISASGSYRQALAASKSGAPETGFESTAGAGDVVIHVKIRLVDEIDVSIVPPSSVFGGEGSTTCVESGGQAVEVSVVGSELGQSFVVFLSEAIPLDVRVRPSALARCA